MTSRDARVALALAAVTLLAHLAFFAAVFRLDVPFAQDTVVYRSTALNLIAGAGYSIDGVTPTANRPPGYSLFLILPYVLGLGDRGAILMQFVVMGSIAGALYLLFRGWAGRSESAVGTLSLSLHPDVLFWSSFVLTDALALAAGVATLLCADLARRRRSLGLTVGAGAVLGYALLIRPSYVCVAPAAALLVLWPIRRESWRAAVSLALGVVLVLAPWTARNVVALGGPYPLSTEGGIVLYAGTTWRDGVEDVDATFEPDVLERVRGMSETETDRYLRERALARIASDPIGYVALGARKLWTVWQPTYTRFSPAHQASDVLAYVVLVGGAILFAALRRGRSLMDVLMLVFLVGVNALLAVTYVDPEFRYRIPALLPLAWYAGQGWVAAASRVRRRHATAAPAAG